MKIRSSNLEAFRRLICTDYGDEAALIRALRGEPDAPSWQMSAGTAWHHVVRDPIGTSKIEFWDGTPNKMHQSGAYRFCGADVARAGRLIGEGLWEVPASKVIGPALVYSEGCDHIRGLVIQDNKTCFSTPDAKRYEDSLQWRVYLLLHDAEVFQYNLWDMSNPKEGYCEFSGVCSVRFYRYPALEADVGQWVERFCEWNRRRMEEEHRELVTGLGGEGGVS